MSLISLIQKLMQRKAVVIGVVDNDIISRSLSRYLFVAQFVRGLVLDVGCGSSYGISIINRVAKGLNDVVGLDIDIDLLRYGKLLYNVDSLILADARFLPFRQQTFDSIICLELIEHLPKIGQIKLCRDLYNALKKDGLLFISTPNKLWFSPFRKPLNPEHIKELYITDLIKILENSGFQRYQLYAMGDKKNFFSYFVNVFICISRLILPKQCINAIDRLLFRLYVRRKGTSIDPNPNIPIQQVLDGAWRFKYFIVKASRI